MKSSTKSNSIDYNSIYKFLFTICIAYFLFVYFDFFLLYGNLLSVGLMFLGIIFLLLNLVLKRDFLLFLSFISCAGCIAYSYFVSTL